MSTTKAIQIKKNGGVEVLEYVDVPSPVMKGTDVLIRNHAIGVNFIDTYHREGIYPVSLPMVLGREGAGIVEAVGDQVTKFKVGDRVVYLSPGSYAETVAVAETMVSILPLELSFEIGAACLLQGLTGLTMVQEAYSIKKGDTVLIHAAAGGMGLVLTQLSKNYGATVIGTTSSTEKAELAKQVGADFVINYTCEDVYEKVSEYTKGLGVQAVFDGVGKDTFESSLKCCAPLATMISFGNASGKVPPVDILKLGAKNIKLMRTNLFNFFTTPESFHNYAFQLLELVKSKKITISIFKTYLLSDAHLAHSDLEGRKTTGKLVLLP
ncbi:hypothetical protein DSO57_1009561 [Entomophthora muscae]|uniref:Uncharacterized protein n=1 Tax=Entomophthora muscae TaxID=34485 RepID=A0ACC2RXY5_9FUNG|nr:hypothetical protein DSO57_1009561 [Entomophthora muscae]